MDEGVSKKYEVKSMTTAIMKTFKIVPIPGFCLRNIHKNKTIKLIKKVVLPTDKPVLIDNPSDKTSQGELPVEEIKINASPNPKQKRPIDKNIKVFNLGLKLRGFFELQFFFGILFIFKNEKKASIKNY